MATRNGYLADGHHRYETAIGYRRAQVARGDARAAIGWIPAYFCSLDDPGLVVLPTHRIVHGLGLGAREVVERLQPGFERTVLEHAPLAAVEEGLARQGPGAFGLLLPGCDPMLLRLRPGALAGVAGLPEVQALRTLDVTVLHVLVLEHLFGMTRDAQERQQHLAYVKDAREAARRVAEGTVDAAFLLRATTPAQVRAVADAGGVMPQKATYFHPKIPDGLGVWPFGEP
jgi:uncharacterized protein (DUF1015 family)